MQLRNVVLCLALLGLSLLLAPAGSADAQPRELDYRGVTAVQASVGGSTPFWHYANTGGQYRPGSSTSWLTGAGVFLPFQADGGVDVSAGVEVVGRVSDATNTLHALQLYGRAQYRGGRLSVGRIPETVGIHWADLSVGSMMVSRNAPPVPMIKLSTPNFLDVPYTDGHVQVRGRWSDGQLGPNREISSPLLHQKTAYLKFNIEAFEGIAGLIQNTVWGGTARDRSLGDYVRVVSGSLEGTEVDQNRVGNTIAAYDFSARYTLADWQIQAYRLFYLEDTVSMQFRSPWDGLWGLGLRRTEETHWINGVLYEHMNTIRQDSPPEVPRGRADYYDHFNYGSGWTYRGTVLGTPLFVFDPEQGEITNNMVIAHHLGIEGAPGKRIDYTLRLTYSRNYGVCRDRVVTGACHLSASEPVPPDQNVRPRGEFREDQYSVQGEIQYLFSKPLGLRVIGSAAVDTGSFYDDRWGFRLGLQWDGSTSLN